MAQFKFDRDHGNKIPRARVVKELERVAIEFGYTAFKQSEFDKIAEISSYKVYREFGSWDKAMLFLVVHFKAKDIDFNVKTRSKTRYSDSDMFNEMEKIWLQLGHRPSRDEWVRSDPEISYDAIYRRFGGWVKACHRFIEYKTGAKIENYELDRKAKGPKNKHKLSKSKIKKIKSRTIPVNLRVKVFIRDLFKCKYCGKSPATHMGTVLHIDHIIPFSKGGENSLENLQTLCEKCNIGKGDCIV